MIGAGKRFRATVLTVSSSFPTKTEKPLKRFLDLKWAPVTGLKPGVNKKVELVSLSDF